jgi:transcriptional regulator with GAF, ATPase, and Fis domain
MYVPPLRERKEDLLKFVNYFINMFNTKFSKNFSPDRRRCAQLLLIVPVAGQHPRAQERDRARRAARDRPGDRRDMLPFSSYRPTRAHWGASSTSFSRHPLPEDGIDFEGLVSDVERALILKASEESQWNQSKTARL